MDAQVKEQMIQMLECINQGTDFAIEHAPEVFQQLIMMHRIYCTASLVLTITAISTTLFLCIKGWKSNWYADTVAVPSVILLFITPIFIALTIKFMSAWIAPQYHIVKVLIS
jgi:hypothetical protein